LAVAGCGYIPEAVARCWALFLGSMAGSFTGDDDPRLAELVDHHDRTR
jgi:hypothetical protein